MNKRKFKTKEEKQVLVNNYLESGLSRKAWCSKNNIPISTLVGWGKQLNRINKDEIIFVSPKPSKEINKDNGRPYVSKDKASDVERAAFTTILEIKECKHSSMSNSPIIIVIDVFNPFIDNFSLLTINTFFIIKIIVITIRAYAKMCTKPP